MAKRMTMAAQALRKRPMPPRRLLELEQPETQFAPAPDVFAWLQHEILEEGGCIHNPEHQHLLAADLAVLWASEGFASKGRAVIGQAELVAFRASGWQRARQELQMREWFGRLPRFLITLDASFCSRCSDTDFCALVEHELYHLAQERDEFGTPKFTQEGLPKISLRGHDVEEFVGLVRRYGAGDPRGAQPPRAAPGRGGPGGPPAGHPRAAIPPAGPAARASPEVSHAAIAGACVTCLLRVA